MPLKVLGSHTKVASGTDRTECGECEIYKDYTKKGNNVGFAHNFIR